MRIYSFKVMFMVLMEKFVVSICPKEQINAAGQAKIIDGSIHLIIRLRSYLLYIILVFELNLHNGQSVRIKNFLEFNRKTIRIDITKIMRNDERIFLYNYTSFIRKILGYDSVFFSISFCSFVILFGSKSRILSRG